MISWESILSVFDAKGTLLKWLQKLEKTLNNAVLQSVSVNPVSAGVITLTFNFADGSTITTPQIDLPEGERGPQGVPGTNGTDGTDGRDALVQNRALSSANISSPMAVPIEALNRTAVVGEPIVMFATDTTENKTYMLIGTVTNVGSPGSNPYVFVTYSNKIDITGMTGPQGPQGPQGPKGEQGEPGTSPTVNIIEYADELPTASETSPAFVQTSDGTLYRKKAVEGGSLIGTWVFTDVPDLTSLETGNNVFNINFLSNGQSYTSLTAYGGSSAFDPNKYIKYNNNTVFSLSSASWTLDAFKTIKITDISSLTNEAAFTSWLTANATKQGGGGGTVTYSYVALADA